MVDAGAAAPTSLDDIRSGSRGAAAAAADSLDECGWRLLESLRGIGVGTEVRVGGAAVVDDPDALSRVEPGDVLVAAAITGAYKRHLLYVAAVATEEGGLLSHTAILSCELGVTVVFGVTDLFARVPDGATVEVDPVAGMVSVVGLPLTASARTLVPDGPKVLSTGGRARSPEDFVCSLVDADPPRQPLRYRLIRLGAGVVVVRWVGWWCGRGLGGR